MIDGLMPYERYKPSGQAWLGDIPSHWEVKPNRALFSEVRDRDSGHEEMLSVTIARGVIRQKALLSETSKKDSSRKDRSAYKLVRPGDIAYNKMRAWQGAVGVSAFRGIVSPAYVVMRPRHEHSARYFHELFRTPAFAKEAERWSYGITSDMWSLRPEHFKMIWSALPPPDEQAVIIRLLGYASRRIDSYIRGKRRLIALLNEQKQAIIQHAVTRGLDPNVPMRDSGVPWLGEIPTHWEARRLKQCITPVEQGWSPQCEAQPAGIGEWGVLKVGCVNKDHFMPHQNKRLPQSLRPRPSLEIRDGDILVSRANTPELLGLAALADQPRPRLLLCDKLFRFRPLEGQAAARFLVHVIRARPSRVQIESSTNGASSSMQNIGQGVLRNLAVALPPLSEQKAICEHIAVHTRELVETINRAEREIALMREYGTRLVSDVVTGQLDVRAAARNLPREEADAADAVGSDEIRQDELGEEDAVA